ncbi:MAG TPA: hypothetical protein VFG68_22445 [Fimbriiglobus sp.]|nr:hypothetical protein [Fimbriiglobus sp.]
MPSTQVSPTRRAVFVLTCCHCRGVRGADGSWSYSPLPAGARLTHGICPVCLGRHYPGVRPPQPAPAVRGS